MRVLEHDRRVAAAAVDVHGAVVALRRAERDAQQAVPDRLCVLPRLGEAVRAPVLEGALAVVVRRCLLDVEAGPVGDHALERHELRIGRGLVERLLEAALELCVAVRVLADRRDPGLDATDAVDGRSRCLPTKSSRAIVGCGYPSS